MKKTLLILLLVLGLPFSSFATVIFNISLNTSPLIGNAAGPFAIDFQLVGDQGTTALLNSFAFGGGAPTGLGNCTGNCSGGFTTSLSLMALSGGFLNEYYQTFSPGTVFTFQLTFDNIVPPLGGTPDAFSLAILDSNLVEIPMAGGNSSFLTISLDSVTTPLVQVYQNNPSGFPSIGLITEPTVTPAGSGVPEPATMAFVTLGLLLIGGARRRR